MTDVAGESNRCGDEKCNVCCIRMVPAAVELRYDGWKRERKKTIFLLSFVSVVGRSSTQQLRKPGGEKTTDIDADDKIYIPFCVVSLFSMDDLWSFAFWKI